MRAPRLWPLADWLAQGTSEERRQSTMRIEQMADEAIGDLMKLREMGEGSGFQLFSSEADPSVKFSPPN